jgi:hypothetical protein
MHTLLFVSQVGIGMEIYTSHPCWGCEVNEPHHILRVKVYTRSAAVLLRQRLDMRGASVLSIKKFKDYTYDAARESIWATEWVGMPEYHNPCDDTIMLLELCVRRDEEAQWSDVLGQRVCPPQKHTSADGFVQGRNRSVYKFPAPVKSPRVSVSAETSIPPKYPIYVVSKGRHESRRTSRCLDSLGINCQQGT